MALLYIDSFEAYANTADMTQRGWVMSGADIDTGKSKFDSQSLRCDGGETADWYLEVPEATCFFSFYYLIDVIPPDNRLFCQFFNNSGFNNTNLYITPSGSIQVRNAANALIGNTSPSGIIQADTWHLIEVQVSHKDIVDNDYFVRVDGVQVINLDGTDTLWSGNANVNRIRLRGTGNLSYDNYYDGLIIYNTAAGLNDFTGHYQTAHLIPTGNGAFSDFLGSDGNKVDNFNLVDEYGCDDDSSYVEPTGHGDRDSYEYTNIGVPGNVLGVQVTSVAKSSNEINQIANFVRIGTTNYDNGLIQPQTGSYGTFYTIWEESPATATAWTISEINDMEAGIVLNVSGGGVSLSITNNDTINLLDGDATILSSVIIQDNAVKHGTITAPPTSVPNPASHHFWLVDTSGGNVNFTPTPGELSTLITGASSSDKFHFTNTGANLMYFTAADGTLYSFSEGEVMSFVRSTTSGQIAPNHRFSVAAGGSPDAYGYLPAEYTRYFFNDTDNTGSMTYTGGVLGISVTKNGAGSPFFGIQSVDAGIMVAGKSYRVETRYRVISSSGTWNLSTYKGSGGTGWTDIATNAGPAVAGGAWVDASVTHVHDGATTGLYFATQVVTGGGSVTLETEYIRVYDLDSSNAKYRLI